MSIRTRDPAAPAGAALDLHDYLAASARRVDAEMARVLEAVVPDPWLRGAIGYHFGWAGSDFRPLPPPERVIAGKRLRPALTLLCHDGARLQLGLPAANGDGPLLFAAALELVHNYSLVHDDIQDRDLLRRGRPTVWSLCGTAQAINVGNCLHAAGFAACLGAAATTQAAAGAHPLVGLLATASMEMTWGQRRDIMFETHDAVTVDMYLDMIAAKTSALIACATSGGALLAFDGAPSPAPVAHYARFGRALGLGFQIRDDILGIWGAESQTGKPSGSDIRRRKRSLPVLLAMRDAAPAAQARLRELYAAPVELDAEEEGDVRGILEASGVQAAAQGHADGHVRQALEALASAAGCPEALDDNPFLEALRQLAGFVTTRAA